MDRPPLRLGAVAYLNTLPLLAGLEQRADVKIERRPPSLLPALLDDGACDAALLPVAALVGRDDLVPVSDACIAALGRVDSVLLLLRRAPRGVRDLVLDPHSRTSQALARICLADLHGASPACREGDPLPAWRAGDGDAVLVIGDDALLVRGEGPPCLDLAGEWYRLTGLPAVFALWVARRETAESRPELAEMLAAARDRGALEIDAIAARAAEASGLAEELLGVYLGRRIHYRLDEDGRRGLEIFLERAAALDDLLPAGPQP